MILMDVNILVYAHREDMPDHPAYRAWVGSCTRWLRIMFRDPS